MGFTIEFSSEIKLWIFRIFIIASILASLWAFIFGILWVAKVIDIESTDPMRLGVGITMIGLGVVCCPLCICFYGVSEIMRSGSFKGGRPYNIEGQPLLTTVTNHKSNENKYNFLGDDWILNIDNIECIEVDEDIRKLLVNHYVSAGIAEYLSIASFNKFSLELVSLSAPSFLIKLAFEAGIDEIKHAKYSFQIANYFNMINNENDEILYPDEIHSHNLDIDNNVNNICIETINDGCFEETVSALIIYYQYKNIQSYLHENDNNDSILTLLSDMLLTIINDEIRHSALAWIAVKYMTSISTIDKKCCNDLLQSKVSTAQYSSSINMTKPNTIQASKFGILSSKTQKKITLQCYKYIIPDLIEYIFAPNNQSLQSMYQHIIEILKSKIFASCL